MPAPAATNARMRPTVTSYLSSSKADTVAGSDAEPRRLKVPPGTGAVAQQLPAGVPHVEPAPLRQLSHGSHLPATHVSEHSVLCHWPFTHCPAVLPAQATSLPVQVAGSSVGPASPAALGSASPPESARAGTPMSPHPSHVERLDAPVSALHATAVAISASEAAPSARPRRPLIPRI